MQHPWHEVSVGTNAPQIVTAIIEVPKGSKNKYELDKTTGLLRLDRVLFSSVHYPANYGFIPQTYCPDNDPLDILVLGQEPVVPLCLIEARPIGVMRMVDQGEEDDKVIAVNINDPEYSPYQNVEELPPHRVKELKRFFQDYKILEGKEVVIDKILGLETTLQVVKTAMDLYNRSFTNR